MSIPEELLVCMVVINDLLLVSCSCNKIAVPSSLSRGVTMTGSASNLTTQWTFRDGRDYVLSLTTTEVPSTISFWISDKITGEEWTGCYDENCIEVLTKRTGCFKSFSTFLSMIKSAILKQSESVVLELLNIHDLAAISIHRQGSVANENEIRSSPLNFPLYNSTATVTSTSNQNTKSQSTPTANSNSNGISNNNNNKTSSLSALNKRKYLIVSYIGEFDKVHYPLPLNYSNPPDLSVMQNNIMKLKAEVTSLRSAKKELEERLESFKLSGGMPQQHSHENNNNKEMLAFRLSGRMEEIGQISAIINQNHAENYGKHIVNGSGEKIMASNIVDYPTPNTASSVTSSCSICNNIIPQLRETIRNLESAISNEKQKHRQTMEKIEAENHFLRQKVDASEKYQEELRNEINNLKEKADIKEMRNKKLIVEVIKDGSKSRLRQSRHDLFYRPQSNDNSKGRSRTKPAVILARKLRSRGAEDSPNRGRSNSSSTRSYSNGGPEIDASLGRKSSKEICRNRSRSPYHPLNYIPLNKKQESTRISSLSPAKRFDPTAYVTEKKAKQNKITDLRLQKIRSRIGTRSPGRCEFNQSHSPSRSPDSRYIHSRNSVSPLPRYMRSLSRERRDYTEQRLNADSIKERLEKRVYDGKTRPLSADIWKSKIPSPVSRRPCSGNGRSPERFGNKSQSNAGKNRESYSDRVSRNAPTFPSELRDHILRSPAAVSAKTTHRGNLNKPRTNNMAINTSWSCDRLEYLVAKHGNPKVEPNDEKDIIVLQNKLSALNAFLETCKSKTKDKDGKEAVAKV